MIDAEMIRDAAMKKCKTYVQSQLNEERKKKGVALEE